MNLHLKQLSLIPVPNPTVKPPSRDISRSSYKKVILNSLRTLGVIPAFSSHINSTRKGKCCMRLRNYCIRYYDYPNINVKPQETV